MSFGGRTTIEQGRKEALEKNIPSVGGILPPPPPPKRCNIIYNFLIEFVSVSRRFGWPGASGTH